MPNFTERSLRPLLIAALCFAFAHTAIAEDIPKDAAGYTEYVAGQLRAELADAAISVKGPLTIAIGGFQANLDRIYTFCQQSTDGCAKEIDTFVKGAAQAYRDQNAPPTREAIRLVVRTTQFVQQTKRSLAPDAAPLSPQPFVTGLVLLPVLDAPRTIRGLNAKDLQSLGLSAEEVQQLALTNLRNSLKPLMDVAKVVHHGQIGQLVGDSFQSSRVVLFDTWEPLAKAQGGKLIVALPAKDAVFYIGDDTKTAINALRTLVRDVLTHAPGPLSDILLRWTPTGWEVVS